MPQILYIMLENYCKSVIIEANTMVDMARTQIAPAVEKYIADVSRAAKAKMSVAPSVSCRYETGIIEKLSSLVDEITDKTAELDDAVIKISHTEDIVAEAYQIRDTVLPVMSELRVPCDKAETMTAKEYWPMPTYADILFSVM